MSPTKKMRTPTKRNPGDLGIGSKSPITKAKVLASPKKVGRQLTFEDLDQHVKAYENMSWDALMDDGSNEAAPTVPLQEQSPCDDLLITSESATTTSTVSQEWMTIAEANAAVSSPQRPSRKSAAPKKTDPQPKFIKSLEMNNMLMLRRSERNKKKVVEEERTFPDKTVRQQRKRRMSIESTVTIESSANSPSRRGRQIPTKTAKMQLQPTTPSRTSSRAGSTFSTPSRQRLDSSMADSPNPRDGWEQPKLGWCYDEALLSRRTKDLEKAKEKDVYQRYATEVPRALRKNGIHPKTPNKFINYSRRSWDSQIRAWKRKLYDWAGLSPSTSVVNSLESSICDPQDILQRNQEADDLENETPSKLIAAAAAKIGTAEPVYNPDQMASLLGHFDMHTRSTGEESTLKAPTNPNQKGPVDFSEINGSNY